MKAMEEAVCADAPRAAWWRATWDELRTGWRTLAAVCLGVGIGLPSFPLYVMPTIVIRLETLYGWSRTDASVIPTAALLGGALATPLVGFLIDKSSPRRVALTSTLFIGVLLLLAATAPSDPLAWQVGALIFGLLGAGSLSVVYSNVVCATFDAARGFALGLMLACTGIMGALVLPMIDRALANSGPELTFSVWSAAYFLFFLPCLFVLLPKSGAAGTGGAAGGAVDDRLASAWPVPWRTLVLLGSAALLTCMAGSAGSSHLVPMTKDAGLPVAIVASVIAASVMLSRPFTGLLVDRFDARQIGAIAFSMKAAGLALVGLFGAEAAVPGAILISLALGAEVEIFLYLISRYVSASVYGRTAGWIYAGMVFAAASGPFFMGLLHGLFEGYSQPYFIFSAVAVVVIILMLMLPPYAREDERHRS